MVTERLDVFTVPVLFLLGLPLAADSADFWLITLAAVGGSILGAAFIIPLRKQMIEIDRLRFPTGTGVAAILKSPGAGTQKALVLLAGVVAGAAVYWFVAAEQLGFFNYGSLGIQTVSADSFDVGRFLDFPPQLELIFGIAPFALGAGYITGRPGLLILAGGILAYHILTPLAFSLGWMPQTVSAADAPSYGFSAFNRPLGIGLLLGGAIMGIVVSLPVIKEAFRSIAAASKLKGGGDELGLRVLVTAVVLAVALTTTSLRVGLKSRGLAESWSADLVQAWKSGSRGKPQGSRFSKDHKRDRHRCDADCRPRLASAAPFPPDFRSAYGTLAA